MVIIMIRLEILAGPKHENAYTWRGRAREPVSRGRRARLAPHTWYRRDNRFPRRKPWLKRVRDCTWTITWSKARVRRRPKDTSFCFRDVGLGLSIYLFIYILLLLSFSPPRTVSTRTECSIYDWPTDRRRRRHRRPRVGYANNSRVCLQTLLAVVCK